MKIFGESVMRYASFENIRVSPLSGFPGSPGVAGGLDFPMDAPDFVHHWRGPTRIDYLPALKHSDAVDEYDAGIYGGFLVDHFGHMMAEFMHRTWYYAIYDVKKLPIVFISGNRSAEIPRFLRDILSEFGIKKIIIIKKPSLFKNLIVPESGATWTRPPKDWYLNIINEKRNFSYLRTSSKIKKIAILRSQFMAGKCCAEWHLEEILSEEGYFILRPENFSVVEQISLIINAEKIIYSEGSAMHLFDIMPCVTARIAVLCRRNETRIPENVMAPRARELFVYRNVRHMTQFPEGSYALSRGLSWVNIQNFIEFLEKNEFISSSGVGARGVDRGKLKEEIKKFASSRAREVGVGIDPKEIELFSESQLSRYFSLLSNEAEKN